MEYDFNILYYIGMYKKWWKIIVKLMAISMFLTVIFSLLIPASYVSTVTIISADSGGSQATSSIGKLLGISGFAGGASSADIIIAILKSNRMARDISAFLELNKQSKFKYDISANSVTSGLIINVKGNDPAYTEKVANFAVQNLDKINGELNITPSRPMVKVLDSASYGDKEPRQIPRKAFIAGLAAFLLSSLYVFLSDYLKKLKTQ
jgi:uncharacterized protein involved in exopolysaccharide biosynthesis